MMFYDFQTTTYGKWILAGEHTVVRGGGALVFPCKEKYLTLTYSAQASSLSFSSSGASGAAMEVVLWNILEKANERLGRSLKDISGNFHIESTIPLGLGMGGSAALCVAVSQWCIAQGWLENKDAYLFSKNLENNFHGKSSGIDIIGVSAEQGMYFKQDHASPIKQSWNPSWHLSSSGQSSMTSYCVEKVQSLFTRNPILAEKIDQEMQFSVEKARQALESTINSRIEQLIEAINIASNCFKQWDLITDALQKHMDSLLLKGAIAVKPTGSGGGGGVLSLWPTSSKDGMII